MLIRRELKKKLWEDNGNHVSCEARVLRWQQSGREDYDWQSYVTGSCALSVSVMTTTMITLSCQSQVLLLTPVHVSLFMHCSGSYGFLFS